MTGATPNAAGVAWDSVDHYDSEGTLRDWDELEAEADLLTETIRRVADAEGAA
jgi:hypothetical protein